MNARQKKHAEYAAEKQACLEMLSDGKVHFVVPTMNAYWIMRELNAVRVSLNHYREMNDEEAAAFLESEKQKALAIARHNVKTLL